MARNLDTLPEPLQAAVNDLVPTVRKLCSGEYAISIGGSLGTGSFDERSDVDLRLFYESPAAVTTQRDATAELERRIAAWQQRGVRVDGCWARPIAEVESELVRWISGEARPRPFIWTLWGYYLPTDIYHQLPVEDRGGVLARWKAMLTPYPKALGRAIVGRHAGSLRYWINDYHYESKAMRGDVVFVSSMAPRLVHDMLQLLYAAAETYYPGDGRNLDSLPAEARLPDDFSRRVSQALYPGNDVRALADQREALVALGNEVLACIGKAPFGE